MCWRTTWCPPGPAPPLRADCAADDDDGYEELPVSLPPYVPQGLSRDDAASAGGEAFAVEQQVVAAPALSNNGGFGIGGGAWLALVCASSVYAKVVGPFRSQV